MGGLSLLLMAGEQTLHTQGHSSPTSGHDSQNPGHDSQISGHDSQSASPTSHTDTLTQSTSEKVGVFKVLIHPFPKIKLNIGKCAFSVAAPTIWNQLPIAIKSSETIATLNKIKTYYLFEICFPP